MIKRGDLRVAACNLQRHRRNGGREQAFEAQGAALLLGEGGPLVQARIAQQVIAGGMGRRGHVGSVRGGNSIGPYYTDAIRVRTASARQSAPSNFLSGSALPLNLALCRPKALRTSWALR